MVASKLGRATFVFCLTTAAALAANSAGLQDGKATLRSAGPLAFGPDGVLFVGDSMGASIVALDTADTKKEKQTAAIDVKGLNEKVAAALGTSPDQIFINDMAVNPSSKKVYLSVSRGRDLAPLR